MTDDEIIARVGEYYSGKLREFGQTPQGVDWNSEAAQLVRFQQVLGVVDMSAPFNLNDFGCGYGALFDRVKSTGSLIAYNGYDIAGDMISAASVRYNDEPRARFTEHFEELPVAEYTVASGVFSVKGETSNADWQRYMLTTIDRLRERSSRGFAFNALTEYSDSDRMRPDLFYADPHALFDFCRTRYARNVALLHDYGLYEFTIRVLLT